MSEKQLLAMIGSGILFVIAVAFLLWYGFGGYAVVNQFFLGNG